MVSKLNTAGNKTVKSEVYDVTYGTAQGSCLGPLLFILFSNDIHLLPTFSQIILFTDDTNVFNSSKNLQFLKYSLEHDMTLLVDWYQANTLSLNVHKTVLLKFGPNDEEFSVRIDDVTVTNKSFTKFLGIIVDDRLHWDYHLNTLFNKLMANKCLLSNDKLLPRQSLLKVYYVHIYSQLTYGLAVWGSVMTKKMQKWLQTILNYCVKLLSKKPKNMATSIAFNELKVLTVQQLIEQELAKIGQKVMHKLYPIPILPCSVKIEGKNP